MFRKFLDREDELRFLEERYRGGTFEFVVIYGRRRIGKTELIKRFVKDKPHLYFLCDRRGTERNAQRLKKRIAEHLREQPVETNDFEGIFSHLAGRTEGERLVVVLDEFSYLVEKDDAIPSIFQAIVDEILNQTKVFLLLCGSSVSMMESGVLSRKSALYGRKTGHIKLGAIPFGSFREFFPKNNAVKNMEFYSVLGGVPFYLAKFDEGKTTLENIREEIFSKSGHLYEEPDFLLREELREPDIYKDILSAIASGRTKVVDIASSSRINAKDIDKYLKVLIRLGIIKRERPVTEPKSKKTLYVIDDNFTSMFFRFCEPYKSDLEIGRTRAAEDRLRRDFNMHMGNAFEKLVREEVLPKANIIQTTRTGRWWGHYREGDERMVIEIDIVSLNEGTGEVLFGECKWAENVDGEKILRELKEKARYVQWPNSRKRREEHFLVAAKSFKKTSQSGHCLDLDLIAKLL